VPAQYCGTSTTAAPAPVPSQRPLNTLSTPAPVPEPPQPTLNVAEAASELVRPQVLLNAVTPPADEAATQAPAVHQVPESRSETNAWECPTCTFQNSSDSLSCEICLERREGESPFESSRFRLDPRMRRKRMQLGIALGAFIVLLGSEIWDLNGVTLLVATLVATLLGGLLGGMVAQCCSAYNAILARRHSSATPLLETDGGSFIDLELDSRRGRQRLQPAALDLTARRQQLTLMRLLLERRQRELQGEGAAVEQERVVRSAPRGLVEALPTHAITSADVAAAPDEHRSCTVCFDEFAEGDMLRTLPCFHRFHTDCIDRWLSRSCLCPICKHSVVGLGARGGEES
jgi:hypothetical protein